MAASDSAERLAAVHHVSGGERPFREVVLVNERQVERWGHARAKDLEMLAATVAELRALASALQGEQDLAPRIAAAREASWFGEGFGEGSAEDLLTAHVANLGWLDESAPNGANLAVLAGELAAALETMGEGPQLDRRPDLERLAAEAESARKEREAALKRARRQARKRKRRPSPLDTFGTY
jgi:hypothetical protein